MEQEIMVLVYFSSHCKKVR
ncbi:hypothetical protein LINGRAHAP2_LOCUS15390 [Linum grandiflorum]